MNTLARWNPCEEMEEVGRRLNSLVDLSPSGGGKKRAPLALLEDIAEDENEYLIEAELPEVSKDNIQVTLEDGVLTIKGERKFEKEQKSCKFHRVERAYGTFVRSFSLPDDADSDKISAEFKNGVLHVHVAKSERAQAKQIQVT